MQGLERARKVGSYLIARLYRFKLMARPRRASSAVTLHHLGPVATAHRVQG